MIVIDWYLNHCVFPVQMRHSLQRLSCSSWDLADSRAVVGFSGWLPSLSCLCSHARVLRLKPKEQSSTTAHNTFINSLPLSFPQAHPTTTACCPCNCTKQTQWCRQSVPLTARCCTCCSAILAACPSLRCVGLAQRDNCLKMCLVSEDCVR